MTSPDRRTPTSKEGTLIDAELRAELRRLLGRRVRFDEPMARHTSLRVGGPANALAQPRSRKELEQLAALCREHGEPLVAIGKGFNALVRDAGLRAVVVRLSELRALERDERGHVFAEAGVTHTAITRFCADQGLCGLEFAVGIPGTVGGWLVMNAGIPEREMKDVTLRVEVLEPARSEIRELCSRELHWHYRRLELPEAALAVSGTFATVPGDREAIRAEMRRHLDHRRATQPVNVPSCGSVFKNPPGDHAGRLIEAAGLKGRTSGGARISDLHANFIVNRGEATATDVLRLIELARDEVERRFGVHLETEVRLLDPEGRT